MIPSSPTDSPPTSLSRPSLTSSGLSRRTYSRRSANHREKRRTEAELDMDSEDDEIRVDIPTAADLDVGSPISRYRNAIRDDDELLDQITVGKQRKSRSPSRSPSPSPSPRPIKRMKTANTSLPFKTSRSAQPNPSCKYFTKQKQKQAPEPVVYDGPPSVTSTSHNKSAPSTPPRRTKSLPGPTTPTSSPRDLSSYFAAVSPRRAPSSPAGDPDDTNAGGSGSRSRTRPGGMRRMLSKTQSMTVLPTTPSRRHEDSDNDMGNSPFGGAMSPSAPSTPSRPLIRTQSMPESPLKFSPRAGVTIDNAASLLATAQAHGQGGSGGRAKRTYGKTRTMLAEVPLANDAGTTAGLSEDDLGVSAQASYTELRERYEIDNTSGELGGSGNLMNELLLAKAPQTVSDMRSKGENRRFMDELGYLVDGISDSANSSMRRSSSIEILSKMQDEAWLTKLKVCGQVEHIWESFYASRADAARVMNVICLLFLVILTGSNSGTDQIVQAFPEQVIPFVVDHIRVRDGLLDGMAKGAEAKTAYRLRGIYKSLACVDHTSEPATRCLASIVLKELCQEAVLPQLDEERFLSNIIKAFKKESSLMSDRFDLYEKSLDLLPEEQPPNFLYISNLLECLSTMILVSPDQRQKLIEKHEDFAQSIIDTAISGTALCLAPEDVQVAVVCKCVIQAVQLLAYLTNESTLWASNIAKLEGAIVCMARLVLQRHAIGLREQPNEPEETGTSLQIEVDVEVEPETTISAKEDDQAMSAREFLCLVLALLATIALSGKDATAAIATIRIDENCVGQHACLRKCRCDTAVSFGRHLAQLYLEHLIQEHDPLSSTLTGYLALLLSKLLLVGDKLADEEITVALPGTHRRDKLGGLLSSLERLNELQTEWQKDVKSLLPKSVAERAEEGDVVQEAIKDLLKFINE